MISWVARRVFVSISPKNISNSLFASLENLAYRRLWPAAWLYYTVRWMELVVLQWLVLELTDSPFQVAFVGASRMAPMLLLGLFAGTIADRFPKKIVLLASQFITLMTLTCLLILIATNIVAPWHTFVGVFCTGTSWALDFSARRAMFSQLFGGRNLTNAISLDTTAMMGSSMLGPIIGGALIAFFGFTVSYVVMLSFSLTAFFLLLLVNHKEKVLGQSVGGGMSTLIIGAVSIVRRYHMVCLAFIITATVNLFGFPYIAMIPVIAREVLGTGSFMFGVLASATGIGALLGSIVIAGRGVQNQPRLYTLGAITMLFGGFVFSLSSYYPLSLVALMLSGLGIAGFGTMQVSIVLNTVAPEERGRAMGIMALGIGISPFGILIVGQLTEIMGPQTGLSFMTAIGVCLLLMLYWRVQKLRNPLPTDRATSIVN